MSDIETEINEEAAEAVEDTAPVKETPTRELFRVRVRYARLEALRYVSHLDMQTVWERTLRRAGVTLAYSRGFSPRPKLHLACALPLGFLSRCEIADIWIEGQPGEPAPDTTALAEQMSSATPPGLDILHIEIVPLSLPALQTLVQSSEYGAIPLDALNASALAQAVEQLMQAESLPRERRGKPYDLRPLIETMEVRAREEGRPELFMRLAAREGATGRPEEVLGALELDPAAFRIERKALILAE